MFESIYVIHDDKFQIDLSKFVFRLNTMGLINPIIINSKNYRSESDVFLYILNQSKTQNKNNVLILKSHIGLLYSDDVICAKIKETFSNIGSRPWDILFLGVSLGIFDDTEFIDGIVRDSYGDIIKYDNCGSSFATCYNKSSYDDIIEKLSSKKLDIDNILSDSIFVKISAKYPICIKENINILCDRFQRTLSYMAYMAKDMIDNDFVNPEYKESVLKEFDSIKNTSNYDLYNRFNMFIDLYKKNMRKKGTIDIIESFDVAIMISSYNRYVNLVHIINQINRQHSKYKYKLFIMNDGSTDLNYEKLESLENIILLKNETNNGKCKYWKTITDLFQATSHYKYDVLIQIDDDFKLCNNFIDHVMLMFKEKGCDVINYHINDLDSNKKRWGLDVWIDGGVALSEKFMKMINYRIEKPSLYRWKNCEHRSSGVWESLSEFISGTNVSMYKPSITLAVHRGNAESKMNGSLRKRNKINSKY